MKTIDVLVKQNEEMVVPFIWVNDDIENVEVSAKLIGQGSKLHIVGIFLGNDYKQITFNTKVFHESQNSFSRTIIRGVFRNNASFSNDGLIRIQKGAKGADGYFASKVLLFDDAKGRSVPSLEIDENELKAGHASTVGRPDENQLLYLRSRGLSEKQAEQLIISGFFAPVLKLLSNEQQKDAAKQITSYL